MRICYIANPFSIHTQRQVRYFADREHKVYLIGISPTRGAISSNDLPSDVTFYDLGAQFDVRKARYLLWALTARRIVREIGPDILHAHQVAGSGWVGAATGYHPFVVTAWGSDLLLGPRRSRIQKKLAKWVLKQADYVTCVSEELVQVATSLGAAPGRIEFAPWGVDTDVFYPVPESGKKEIRADLGLNPEGPLVVSIRAIKDVYNPLDIAQAIPLILKQIPETRFIIRTYNYDKKLLEQFQAIIQTHNVSHSVQYLGDLPDEFAIADLYRASDVAISIPSSDGTPSSVMETLACGVPIILSDIPALQKWVQHECEGLFVPLYDATALGNAIIRLLKDKSLYTTLSTNGVKLIDQRADSKIWMHRNEEIYAQLIKMEDK